VQTIVGGHIMMHFLGHKHLQAFNNFYALFAWLISRIFSANEQYFSFTTNQPTVFSALATKS